MRTLSINFFMIAFFFINFCSGLKLDPNYGESKTLLIGETFSINCIDEKDGVTWTAFPIPKLNDAKIIPNGKGNKTLWIKSANKNSHGVYECSQEHGNSTVEIIIYVELP